MRLSHILLVATVTFLSCYGTIAAAHTLALETNQEISSTRRFLKGNHDMDARKEERVTTPQFGMLSGLLKIPKFSKFPGIKQLNRLFHKAGKNRFNKRWKTKYEANNF
ncbi:Avirulence (Avh) protein [Phytophthora megakarya]|uniref:RxLR effector protein n=1 Tax=Phytophthora megakarya TaxID=4795 RepID=A0A225V8L8_9STRA|nr:Avirulence (Avh) protein [Phytophthora megakarya]